MSLDLGNPRPLTSALADDLQEDCVLGPVRVTVDAIGHWENEGGRVWERRGDVGRDGFRGKAGEAAEMAVATKASAIAAPHWPSELNACGRCHGPVARGRLGLFGWFLSHCVPVEHYHCLDPSCGWSRVRLRSASISDPLSARGQR